MNLLLRINKILLKINSDKLTFLERHCITKNVKNQSCDNHNLLCMYYSYDKNKFDKFIEQFYIVEHHGNSFMTKDGERWYFYDMSQAQGYIRGYRFYKLKVPKTINRDIFFSSIYPWCDGTCCDIEFLNE